MNNKLINSDNFNPLLDRCKGHKKTLENLKLQLNVFNDIKSAFGKLEEVVYSEPRTDNFKNIDESRKMRRELTRTEREACAVVYEVIGDFWRADYEIARTAAHCYYTAAALHAQTIKSKNTDELDQLILKVEDLKRSQADTLRDAGINLKVMPLKEELGKKLLVDAVILYKRYGMIQEAEYVINNHLDKESSVEDYKTGYYERQRRDSKQ